MPGLPSGGPGGCNAREANRGVRAGEALLPGAVPEENPGEGLLTRRHPQALEQFEPWSEAAGRSPRFPEIPQ